MKKILIALIAVAMLLPLGIVAFADEPQNSYTLLTHWDFEGDNPLADKATSGVSNDTLTKVGSFSIENGVAAIPKAGANYLTASGASGTDLYSMKDKTVIIKVKLVRDAISWLVAGFVSKDNVFGYGVQPCRPSSAETTANAAVAWYFTNERQVVNGSPLAYDEYRVFAMTLDHDDVTGKMTIKQYMSTKEVPTSAEDFTIVHELKDLDGVAYESADDLILGRRFGWLGADVDRQLATYIDDVKVFDGVLNASELATESPKTTVVDAPAEDDNGEENGEENDEIVPTTPIKPDNIPNVSDNDEDTNASTNEVSTDTTDTLSDEGSGCGSYVGIGAVAIVAVSASMVLSKRKKNK